MLNTKKLEPKQRRRETKKKFICNQIKTKKKGNNLILRVIVDCMKLDSRYNYARIQISLFNIFLDCIKQHQHHITLYHNIF
jgi:hypothetical protein